MGSSPNPKTTIQVIGLASQLCRCFEAGELHLQLHKLFTGLQLDYPWQFVVAVLLPVAKLAFLLSGGTG